MLSAPAAGRNRGFIRDVLHAHLPETGGFVLEIASGSGEHVVHFAAEKGSRFTFQPSDPDAASRKSIDAWVEHLALPNVLPALPIDALDEDWKVAQVDAVVNINMVHISPWEAAVGLFKGAQRVLKTNGILYMYGPFRRAGAHTSPGNEAFDKELRGKNPLWGVRDLEDIAALAKCHGFSEPIVEAMPANNLSLIFTKLLDLEYRQ